MKNVNFNCEKFNMYERKYSKLLNKERRYFLLSRENLIDLEIDDNKDFAVQKKFITNDCYVIKFFDIKQYFLLKSYSLATNDLKIIDIVNESDNTKKVITDINFFPEKMKKHYTSEILNFLKIVDYVNKENNLELKGLEDLIVIKTKEIGEVIFPHDKFRTSAAQSFEARFIVLGINQNIEKVNQTINIFDRNLFTLLSLASNKLMFVNLKEKLYTTFSY